jgi:RNA polymerase sigma-70 factor (ECF subfamily)
MPGHDVESELFERFRRQGDAAALAEVYDRTAAELLRVALHMSRSPAEAEDLVQSTFLAAIESAASYDGQRPLRPWLAGILANQARRRQRAEARQARSLPAVAARAGSVVSTADPLARSEAGELTEAVDDAIAGLPETYRPVLRLHLKHGFLAAEIAHVLDRPPGTVRTQIVRGLDLLRKLLPSGLAVAGALLSLVGRGLAAVRERVLANVGNRVALTGALGAASLKTLLGVLAAVALLALVVFGVWPWGPEPGSVGDAMAPAGPEVVAEKTATRPADETAISDDESAARRAAAATATPAATGSLQVSVRVAPDGGPLAGIGVSLVPEGADALLDQRQQRTDERGEARFADLPAGFMEVETDRGIGRRVEVRAGVESRLELLLEAGFDIEGNVADERGRGVAEAAIWLSKTGNQLYQGDVAGRADANGAFVLRTVQGARVFVAARAPGRGPSCKVLVARPESGRVARVTLKLEGPGAALRGDVRDERDLPVAGASLRLSWSHGFHDAPGCREGGRFPPAVEARTNEQGSFAMEGLPAGRHPLLVRAAGWGPWFEYVDVASEPARLVIRLRRGLTLEGRVRDQRGQAVAGARVTVKTYAIAWSATSRTASDGSYRIPGLDPERIQVVVEKEGYRELRRVLERDRLVPATDDPGRPSIVRFDAVLEPVLTLRCRLLDAAGAAVAGRVVMLVLPGRSERPRRVTDESGRITFTALGPGEHSLLLYTAVGQGERPVAQHCLEIGRVRPGPDEVIVRLPERTPDLATVRGCVLDAEGRPAGDLGIQATQMMPGGEILLIAATGSTEPGSGTFRIDGLAPGRHILVLRDGGAKRPQLEVPAFELRPGEERDLGVLTLPPAGWLEVRADTTGIVLRDVAPRCEVHAANGRGVTNEALPAGGLRLVLAAGRYQVNVFGTDGFVTEYRQVDVTAGRTNELVLVLRPGVRRQLVFPVPEPPGWQEVRRFRVEIESRDGTVRVADDFEARDWPFSWLPSLAPGSYVMRVTPDRGKAIAGSFVVEDLLPRLAPIRVALQ